MEIELKDKVCSIIGATIKVMEYHVMGCLEDESPDTILLLHGANNLRSEESAAWRLRVT